MNIKSIISRDLFKHAPEVLATEQFRKTIVHVATTTKEQIERNEELRKRIDYAIKKYEGLK